MKNYYFLGCLLLAAAAVQSAQAEVTYTCTAGKNFGDREGIDKMFDGDTSTKLCKAPGADCYALVAASEAVYVRGYETTTANDNKGNDRSPHKWGLYGTNDEAVASDANSAGWVTLSEQDNDLIPKENYYTQRFYCDKNTVGTAYKYFKVVFNTAGEKGEGNLVQLSEFKILGETEPIVTYDWVGELSAPNSNKAVDWSLTSKWEGGDALVGKSLVIKTSDDKAYTVNKYSLTTHDDNSWNDRAPKTWIVEGSNDGTEWETIDEVTEGNPIANERAKTFDFEPSNKELACKYIKLTINSIKGNGHQQLGEFHVFASAHQHVWVKGEHKNATCIEAGGDIFTCSVCGETKFEKTEEPTGVHNYVTDEHGHGHCSDCGRPDPAYLSAVDGFYQPTTADHFVWLAEMIQFNENVNIRLTEDVDLTGFAGFGNGEDIVPFKGEFDGKGHWLKKLKIDVTDVKNVGLFGKLEGANIHDLGIENAYVKSNKPNVGVLAGTAKDVTVNRVAVTGSESSANGYDHVAAILGDVEGNSTVSNCMSDITVHSTDYQAGGLIGTTRGLTLENSLFTGKVLNDKNNAGGLVALLEDGNPTIIRNNISAASLLKANNDGQKSIVNTGGRTATYQNNRVAASQLYQKGSEEPVTKAWNIADNENGLTTADRDMKCLSFYTETMGWDMEIDWKFIEAGMYPVLAWMDGEAGSQTVSVPETRYATAIAEAELNIPEEGVEVYAVLVAATEDTPEVATAAENADAVQAADKDLTLVKLTGVIPANTPVLVKAAKGDYTFSHHVEYGENVAENHLTAAAEDVTADGTHYTLKVADKKVGFARVSNGETVPAGSVYLTVPASSTKDFYTLYNGTQTGVENVAVPTEEGAETIYNVAGQRLNRMQKGINIVNGKKILK